VPKAAAKGLEGKEGVLWGIPYDPHLEAYKRVAKLFNEKTGATMKVQPGDWDVVGKLVAALAAGTQPDVQCAIGRGIIPLYFGKALLPLKDAVYAAQGVDPQKDFAGDAIEPYTWKGEIYGVPLEANQVGHTVHLPVDEVKALGLADKYPPTNGQVFFESHESLWELARKLQKEENGRVTRWGLSSKGHGGTVYLGIVRTLLSKEGTDWWDNRAKKFNIDTEAGVEAMKLLAETPVKMGIETELDEVQAGAIMSGKVAIARGCGPDLREAKKLGFTFGLAGAPKIRPPELPLFVGEGGWGFIVPKTAKNLDVAVEFLKVACTLEGQREFAKIYGGLMVPAWKALHGKFDHFEDPSPDNPIVAAAKVMQQYLTPQTRYYGEGYGNSDVINTATDEICSEVRQGRLTAAEGAKQLQKRFEAHYNDLRKDLEA
jgi:ABC-type glycerol-3-phosphate transport system substrate-binding protein